MYRYIYIIMYRDNLASEIWGPKGWFFIDSIVLGYPE
jgi:hypothetical protein